MKIVVIGGTGLIGKKLVKNLSERGHDVLAASPNTGVNTITREGLPKALDGAEVVVDVANAPAWEDKAVLEFFETSGRNLLAAEAAAGVRHHVALSIVGSERLPDNGYFRAKVAQESLIKASGIPYTILRATQFFEFVGGIAQSATVGEERSPMSRSHSRLTARSKSPVRRPCRSTNWSGASCGERRIRAKSCRTSTRATSAASSPIGRSHPGRTRASARSGSRTGSVSRRPKRGASRDAPR